ncbi:3-oxoacyl-ACP synthase III [Halobacteriovorax vibrionivorans]|uniref:3-oxoacyl-ACP synthase III n=1 Tax=Halobacteriovorax vibrionivorans TaxID=2152716 RepID=A0ABY0IE20_9BACT|nr:MULTISPECIES: 3-oxoacyl-ACP synthase III [Halobacteriovorax]RZF20779.1 3-oxoacyl-ACP synthase III [Halobacteriovorax vibrionivorans]TGD46495.1 3-oxoacyl-ACP synthase III [Halobacteriovorax sp. Y22]
MKYNNVVIEDYAYIDPPEVLTSDKLEELLEPIYTRLKLPHGRLELMTGIRSRGFWPNSTRPSSIATQAGEKLLEKLSKKGIQKRDIKLLINSSVCRDFLEPSTASVIHSNLEMPQSCSLFDISNACLGMISGWEVVANMIETGAIKRAIILSGENSAPLLENTIKTLNEDQTITRKSVKKFFANLTIGSAGVAYCLAHKSEAPNAPQITSIINRSDSTANKLCQGDGNPETLVMETDSEELLKYGKALAKKTFEESQLKANEIDIVIGHQVGKAHKEVVLTELGLNKHQTFDTFDTLGNTGSAALPITLAKMNDEQGIEKGKKVALVGIGSGLSCSVLGVTW